MLTKKTLTPNRRTLLIREINLAQFDNNLALDMGLKIVNLAKQ